MSTATGIPRAGPFAPRHPPRVAALAVTGLEPVEVLA